MARVFFHASFLRWLVWGGEKKYENGLFLSLENNFPEGIAIELIAFFLSVFHQTQR